MAELLSGLQHLKKFAGNTHNIKTALMKYMRSDIPIFFICKAIEWTRESVRPTFFEASRYSDPSLIRLTRKVCPKTPRAHAEVADRLQRPLNGEPKLSPLLEIGLIPQ